MSDIKVQHYNSFNKGVRRPQGRRKHLELCGFKLVKADISSDDGSPVKQAKEFYKFGHDYKHYVLLDVKSYDGWTFYDVYAK